MSLGSLIRRVRREDFKILDLIKQVYAEDRVKDPLYEDDWFRVSSLGMICEREEVLCSLNGISRPDKIKADAGVNFEHGHAVHWMFQNKVLPALGVLVGSWRCTYCGTVYGSRDTVMVPRPERCIRCGAIAGERPRNSGRPDMSIEDNAFIFVEEWLGNEEHRIGGSPDGQVMAEYSADYSPEDLTLVEFKSCNEKNYQNYKKAPDFVHAVQTQIYMWLTGSRQTKILYFNKNGGQDSIAEHDISYDEECVERVLAGVQAVRDGVAKREIPKRTVCADYNCGRAYGCKARDLCFKD